MGTERRPEREHRKSPPEGLGPIRAQRWLWRGLVGTWVGVAVALCLVAVRWGGWERYLGWTDEWFNPDRHIAGTLVLKVSPWFRPVGEARTPLGRSPVYTAMRDLLSYRELAYGIRLLDWKLRVRTDLGGIARLQSIGVKWVRFSGGVAEWSDPLGTEPTHRRVVVPDFELSRTEVTVAQYKQCMRAGSCGVPENVYDEEASCSWLLPDSGHLAMNCVDYASAKKFARWVGARLPTWAEYAIAFGASPTREVTPPGPAGAWVPVPPEEGNVYGYDCGPCGCVRAEPPAAPCGGRGIGADGGLCDLRGNLDELVSELWPEVSPHTETCKSRCAGASNRFGAFQQFYLFRGAWTTGFRMARTVAQGSTAELEAQRGRLDIAEADLRTRAALTWETIARSHSASWGWRTAAVETWLARYRHTAVRDGTAWREVEVPEVALAQAELGRLVHTPMARIEGATVVASFELARRQVSVGEYQRCVRAEVCSTPRPERACPEGGEADVNRPMVCVTPEQAETYARWVGARLPTVAEWRHAAEVEALDAAGRWRPRYNAASDLSCFEAEFDWSGPAEAQLCTCPGNGLAPEVCDLAGILSEWVQAPAQGEPHPATDPATGRRAPRWDHWRVGGGFEVPALHRADWAVPAREDHADAYTGFRLARD